MLSMKKATNVVEDLLNSKILTTEQEEALVLFSKEMDKINKPKAVLMDGNNVYCPNCHSVLWEIISSRKPHCPDCATKLNWRGKKISSIEEYIDKEQK